MAVETEDGVRVNRAEGRPLSRGPKSSYWDEVGFQLANYRRQSAWRKYCDTLNQRWLRRHLPQGQRAALKTDLFDEAVDEGAFSILAASVDQVCGIDVAGPTCRLAVNRFPALKAVAADVRKLPFADSSFDLIVSLSTLDHFPHGADIEQGLKALHQALRPGGCLLLTLDNPSNPVVRLRNAIPWNLLRKSRIVPYHVGATITSGQLCTALQNAGFHVQEVGTLLHFPRVAGVVFAGLLDKCVGRRAAQIFCRLALPFEFLAALPTARWSGYFTSVKAFKSAAGAS